LTKKFPIYPGGEGHILMWTQDCTNPRHLQGCW